MNTQALYMFLLSLEVLFLFLIELYISMIGRGLLDLHSPVDSYKLLIVKRSVPSNISTGQTNLFGNCNFTEN